MKDSHLRDGRTLPSGCSVPRIQHLLSTARNHHAVSWRAVSGRHKAWFCGSDDLHKPVVHCLVFRQDLLGSPRGAYVKMSNSFKASSCVVAGTSSMPSAKANALLLSPQWKIVMTVTARSVFLSSSECGVSIMTSAYETAQHDHLVRLWQQLQRLHCRRLYPLDKLLAPKHLHYLGRCNCIC